MKEESVCSGKRGLGAVSDSEMMSIKQQGYGETTEVKANGESRV